MGLTQAYGCVHTGVPVCTLCTTTIMDGPNPNPRARAVRYAFVHELKIWEVNALLSLPTELFFH